MKKIFLIQLMGYDDDNKSDIMDGPYIMTSFEEHEKDSDRNIIGK